MEAKNADLAGLRINRSTESAGAVPPRRTGRWLALGVPAAVVVVLGVVLLTGGGALGSALPVHLTPATMISPARAGALLVASGYVVAQRKAAVASKGTGRLVYLGVVEGDRVRAGQVIARIEDADVRAQVAEVRFERVKASIAVAQATLQAADVALENTVIRAPFDGTVLTKNADVGEVVAPLAASAFSKSAVVTLADLSSLQVEADVAESNLEGIALGQPCEIVLDAYPDVRYPGSVAKIVPTADLAKATVQVKVAFRSYDARVLPEMSAKVHFLPRASRLAADTQPILVVPSTAVAERNGRSVVFVVEQGRAAEVPVVTGRQLGSSVAIRQGLRPGVAVVDSVGARLRGGVKVTVQ